MENWLHQTDRLYLPIGYKGLMNIQRGGGRMDNSKEK